MNPKTTDKPRLHQRTRNSETPGVTVGATGLSGPREPRSSQARWGEQGSGPRTTKAPGSLGGCRRSWQLRPVSLGDVHGFSVTAMWHLGPRPGPPS